MLCMDASMLWIIVGTFGSHCCLSAMWVLGIFYSTSKMTTPSDDSLFLSHKYHIAIVICSYIGYSAHSDSLKSGDHDIVTFVLLNLLPN